MLLPFFVVLADFFVTVYCNYDIWLLLLPYGRCYYDLLLYSYEVMADVTAMWQME